MGLKLILEGCDNSGKSTLSEQMLKRATMHYHHPGGRPPNHQSEYLHMSEQMRLLEIYPSILMDRCTAISQQIYTPDDRQDDIRMYWLKEVLHWDDVIVVFCRPSTDWLMSFENFTWRDGETEEFKQEIIRKQHIFVNRYDALMRRIPHIHYDYQSHEAEYTRNILHAAIAGDLDAKTSIKSLITPGNLSCT